MDIQVIQVTLQTVSSLAIAGGFVFAGLQLRNARRAAHVSNFTRLVELQMQLRRMRVEDPTLAAVYRDDVEGLMSHEDIRRYFFNLMQLSVFEIAWFSHRQGQLSDDYYESWVKRMQVIFREESFTRMMDNPSMKILHDDFQKHVQELWKRANTGRTERYDA